ncbi:DUF5667 domain-containing protein [Streptomyces sp. ACA25]|uniref:DUF5667 domain-containing protein n=1 Tax=Streptomyces sp. ACA25 TaxID=3022596 RepID=UPI002308170A|nr:DUF5667 domain-containing protein [Streptomyces sp. ACA25]MDB1087880.1 DUF5667 domain-containing protein [Streptomyces sp. ACA25]
MIRSVSANRRAHAFAQALAEPRLSEEAAADPTPADPGATAPGSEVAVLLSVVHGLEALPEPELSPGTKVVQRARLVAAMEAAVAEGGAEGRGSSRPGPARSGRGAHRATPVRALSRLRPRTRLTKGLAAGGLTVGVAAGAFGGAAAASTGALPGDTLYGLKRGMEDLRLDFAQGDADRGRVHLDRASTRLNESVRLMERRKAGELNAEQISEVRQALSSMHRDASEGHRLLSGAHASDGSLDPLRSLSAFTEKHRDTWDGLSSRLPAPLHDVRQDVTSLFEAMEDDLLPLRQQPATESTGSTAPDDSRGGTDGPTDLLEDAGELPGAEEHPERSTPEGPRETGEATSPAVPSGEPSEGLLGGTGLLDPGRDDSGQPSESTESDPGWPQPDITVPPLLEDLLPGLGIEVRKTD